MWGPAVRRLVGHRVATPIPAYMPLQDVQEAGREEVTASEYKVNLLIAFLTSFLPAIATNNYWLCITGALIIVVATTVRVRHVNMMKKKELS